MPGILLSPSRCCCGGTCTTCFRVTSCITSPPRTYSGIEVRVRSSSGGTLLGSGTTDSTGKACVTGNMTSGSSYWVEFDSIGTGFDAFGATRTITCGNSASPTSLTAPVSSGYFCPCIATGVGSACDYPIPNTITFNDGIGDVTLTNTTDFSAGSVWNYVYSNAVTHLTGCAMRTTSVAVWNFSKSGCPSGTQAQAVVTIPIVFGLYCIASSNSGLVFQVFGYTGCCCISSPCSLGNRYVSDLTCDDLKTWSSGTMAGFGPTGTLSGTLSCGPLIATTSWTTPARNPSNRFPQLGDIYPGAQTWTLSE